MGALTDEMRRIVDQLRAAGIRATDDPRQLNLPCVIVGPPSISELDTGSSGLAMITAYVVGLPPGNLASWRAIDDLAEQVGRVVDVELLQPVNYEAESGKDPLPALQLTWTRQLTWPSEPE